MSASKTGPLMCTSCEAMESAVSSCSECVKLLCPKCNEAHRLMHHFEKHGVVSSADRKQSDQEAPSQQPMLCETTHPTKNIECQVIACNGGSLVNLQEGIQSDQAQRREVPEILSSQSRAAIESHHETHTKQLLQTSTLQCVESHRAILQECRDNAGNNWESFLSERVLEILNSSHCAAEAAEQIYGALKFTSINIGPRIVDEISPICRLVINQLIDLLSHMSFDLGTLDAAIKEFLALQTAANALITKQSNEQIFNCFSHTAFELTSPRFAPLHGYNGAISNTAVFAPIQQGLAGGACLFVPPEFSFNLRLPPTVDVAMTFGITSQCSHHSRDTYSDNSKQMTLISKFCSFGAEAGELDSPRGFCLSSDGDVVVADTNNHRIQVFAANGHYKFHFGLPGKRDGRFWRPRKVAVVPASGELVICDVGRGRARIQIFSQNGRFVERIYHEGLIIVSGVAVDRDGNIVFVDSWCKIISIISRRSGILREFNIELYLSEPGEIAMRENEYYICDFKGNCVVVFDELGRLQRRISCGHFTNFPSGVDISDDGNVLIGDSYGRYFHVAVSYRDRPQISEFSYQQIPFDRCCGLKIAANGDIVTVCRNTHCVVVMRL